MRAGEVRDMAPLLAAKCRVQGGVACMNQMQTSKNKMHDKTEITTTVA